VDPECYSEEVHRTLADEGLAPLLLGTARVAGAPFATVMEYLMVGVPRKTTSGRIEEQVRSW